MKQDVVKIKKKCLREKKEQLRKTDNRLKGSKMSLLSIQEE